MGALVERAQRAQPDFRLPAMARGREIRRPRPSSGEPHGSRPREKQARAKGNGLDKAEAVILDPTDPYKSAAVFLERHCSHKDGRTLQRHRGSFYAYTGTHYREMQAEEIRRVLYLFLDGAQVWRTAGKKTKGEEPTFELAPFKPNRNHVHDLVDTVQARAGIDDQLAMPCWLGKADPQGTVIPMANGLLELATGKLLPALAALLPKLQPVLRLRPEGAWAHRVAALSRKPLARRRRRHATRCRRSWGCC